MAGLTHTGRDPSPLAPHPTRRPARPCLLFGVEGVLFLHLGDHDLGWLLALFFISTFYRSATVRVGGRAGTQGRAGAARPP